jgi:hypothetical protein
MIIFLLEAVAGTLAFIYSATVSEIIATDMTDEHLEEHF